MSEGKRIEFRVDGMKIYSTGDLTDASKCTVEDLQWKSIVYFLKASDSAFSHSDRFRTVMALSESPKSFTEIKELLSAAPATTSFHLKKLIEGMIIHKNENGRYDLTLLGQLVLGHFSKFLEEASALQKIVEP